MPRARTVLLSLLVASAVCAAAPAGAKIGIGISEQNPNVFANKYFKQLKLRYARIVVPWDITTRKDYWRGYLKAWLAGAKADHIQPHVAFGIKAIEPKYFGKGPTPKQYAKMFKRFRKRYPQVRTFSPWNEENHVFQPTARRPKLAAKYYRIVKKNCRGCKVLAADMLDDANLSSWLRRYKKAVGPSPRLWGLHNYQDANKHRSLKTSWTYQLTKLVRGDIWSTEAGGLVGFKTVKGRVAYKYSLSRQRRAQKYLFKLMANRRVRSRYKRVYVYNFFGTWSKRRKTNRWDSGLIGLNGKPRPAFRDLKKLARKNRGARRAVLR